MVATKDADELTDIAQNAMNAVLEKKKRFHTDKLFCKMLIVHQHMPWMKSDKRSALSVLNQSFKT